MGLINSWELRFGRHAIPGLLRILGTFQGMVFFLLWFAESSTPEGSPSFAQFLVLTREGLLAGELWRPFSLLILPAVGHPLWAIVKVMLMWWMSDILDRAWGAFRVNLYVFGAMVACALGVLVGAELGMAAPMMLFYSYFLALATIAPDYEIRLFFILPIKLKYLGILDALILAAIALGGPPAVSLGVLCCVVNYLVFAGPKLVRHLKTRAEVEKRRGEFKRRQLPEADYFHRCEECGVTDQEAPELEYRVDGEGREICERCLGKAVG